MKKKNQIQILLEFKGKKYEELENARHKLRAPNYTETARILIQKGLEAIA